MTADRSAPVVLIVDDQRVVLRVYALALEGAGYQVRVADSADAALESVRVDKPDAVMVDLTMPYINGMGLLYRLQEMAPQIPVAMITGMSNVAEETRQELDALGISLHFKPLAPGQIADIVKSLVGTSRE
jgi:DNA-binding NtrC family response regulator